MILIIYNFVPKDYHILSDVSSSGRENPWQDKKIKTGFISSSYSRIGNETKAMRLKECGTYLEFKRFLADGKLKLHSANFCKVRLCPLCAWRRSLKVFGQVSKIMNEATKDENHQFIFLTLTVKNCSGSELSKTIDSMMKGYKYIFERTKVKKAILGSFRALEVTHNTNPNSNSYNTYHPHLHCILMVNKNYWKKTYITQKEWSDLWKESVGLDYSPQVHVEKIRPSEKNIKKAVAEVAKYSVKDSDLLNQDEKLQDECIMYLDTALAGRRLISFRGQFAKIQKQLKLDDMENGDLINCDGNEEELREDLDFVIERYRWNVGYYQYLKIDDNNEFER